MGSLQSRRKKPPRPLTDVKIRTSEPPPRKRYYIDIGLIIDKKTLCVESINHAIATYLGNYTMSECEENKVYKGFITEYDMKVVITVRREKHRFEGGCGRMYSRYASGDVFVFLYDTSDMTNIIYARKAFDWLKSGTTSIVPVLMVRYNYETFGTWQKVCPLFCGRTDFASVFSTLCRDILYHIASYLFLLYTPLDKHSFCRPEYCIQCYDSDLDIRHAHIVLLDDYSIGKCLNNAIKYRIEADLGR